jgi:hypothetical protein
VLDYYVVRRVITMRARINGYGFMAAMILAIAAIGLSFAQKRDNTPGQSARKGEDQAKARYEMSKSVAGGLMLDALTVKEADWILSNGTFVPMMDDVSPSGVFASFKKGEETIHISVFDFGTAERAENTFSMPRSMGTEVPIKLGDRGEKVYIEGRMTGLNFRIGNLRVGIGGTNDEKLAEKFARHVLEAIKGIAVK